MFGSLQVGARHLHHRKHTSDIRNLVSPYQANSNHNTSHDLRKTRESKELSAKRKKI